MPENAAPTAETLNPKSASLVEKGREWAPSDENSPIKSRILTALARDASHGAFESVASLAEAAAKAGASTEEITEALGVRQFTGGARSLYTSARALGELQRQRRRHESAGAR